MPDLLNLTPDSALATCTRCGTELPPTALACPACATLVHGVRLQELATRARASSEAGDVVTARGLWSEALSLLPEGSQQHRVVREKLAAMVDVADASRLAKGDGDAGRRGWQGWAGGALTIAFLLIGKLKFLLLGLTKASTFISMFASFSVYWSLYGWPLAFGLVVSIYIHEMGHVSELRRLGIQSGAPLFIPGIGALVMLKQHVSDPITNARIGLAGPVWGLGAGLAAWLVYQATGVKTWQAIAQLTGFLNLFNLLPTWQFDGSRGFDALNRQERWLVIGAITVVLFLTGQRLLIIVGAVAVYRAFQKIAGPGDRRALTTFVVLIGTLAWLARGIG